MSSKEVLTLILKDLGATDEVIQRLNTIEDMEAYRQYLESRKNAKAEQKVNNVPFIEEKKEEKKLNNIPFNQLPDASDIEPFTAEELNDPLQPAISRLNLADPRGRIIKLYSKRFPSGGIF